MQIFQRIKSFFNQKKKHVSVFNPLLLKLNSIDFESFNNVFSSNYSLIKVKPFANNIEDCNTTIKSICNSIKERKISPNSVLINNNQTIYLTEFFINKNGFIIDPLSNLLEFKQNVEELILLYEQLCEKTDKEFVDEKNQFIVSRFIGFIINLVEELFSASNF